MKDFLLTTKHAKYTKMKREILSKEESYKIMGACFEVYTEKGNGFLESVYQECLSREFSFGDIVFNEKPKLEIYYERKKLDQCYEPGFLCYDPIILELKAVKNLADQHRTQVINYRKSTN